MQTVSVTGRVKSDHELALAFKRAGRLAERAVTIGQAVDSGALLLAPTPAFILSQTVASGWQFAFPISAAVIGLLVAGFVDLTFGIYPARQAARKNPIEALRYE